MSEGILTEQTDPISDIRHRFNECKKGWKKEELWKDVWWVKDLEFLLQYSSDLVLCSNTLYEVETKRLINYGENLSKENTKLLEQVDHWQSEAIKFDHAHGCYLELCERQKLEIEHLKKENSRLTGIICAVEKGEAGSSHKEIGDQTL